MRSRRGHLVLSGVVHAVHAVHAVLLGAVVGVACLGVMTGPARVTLLGAPIVGAVAAAVPCLAAWGGVRPRPARPALAVIGCAGALAVPLGAGLPLLGLPVAALLLAPVALGVPWRYRAAGSASGELSGNRHGRAVPWARGRS